MKKTITHPAPNRNPEGILVGVHPSGSTWTAWRDPGETDADLAAKVATMHEALADAWKRAASLRKVA
jgi:hypothetical protein